MGVNWLLKIFVVLLLLLSVQCQDFPKHLKPSASQDTQINAVYGLIARLLGNNTVSSFKLQIIPPNLFGNDVFQINATKGVVTVSGNSGVSLASGVYWYLKYFCGCEVSWGRNGTGDQLSLPYPLPDTPTPITVESPVKFRYYMNVCTVSYSSVWWTWERWEREIDWMALNGINMPLAFTGQEYVWEKLFKQVGLSDSDIDDYFTGPAFLAWNRMGNIRGWAGTLPETWRQNQAALQKKIVQRQREFGMITVLPGFAGHVPKAFQKIFPNANFTSSGGWSRFGPTYSSVLLLQPTDPHFPIIGNKFMQILIDEFGTDHIYNADTYNELTPQSNASEFLRTSSQAVYSGMSSVDPDAVWLMQGWLFEYDPFWGNAEIEAYLSGVTQEQMIILDLASDINPQWQRTDSYYGKPWIWCMLHNFGGNRGLYGNLQLIATNPVVALNTPGSSMIGTGITMEAIEQNPIIYNLMNEMGWRQESVNSTRWASNYASRRYNTKNTLIQTAWNQMVKAVYGKQGFSKSIMDFAPTTQNMMSQNTKPNATLLTTAWRNFYQASKTGDFNATIGTYSYDLVDLTSQCMLNLFYDMYVGYYVMIIGTRDNYTMPALNSISKNMLGLIMDLDKVLGSDVNFLLGNWLSDALNLATNPDEKKLFLFNAKNQVTLWGPLGEINDYAAKHWNGLVGDYYYSRWQFFFETAANAVSKNQDIDWPLYSLQLLEYEQAWCQSSQLYPNQATGNTLSIVSDMLDKYAHSDSQYISYQNEDVTDYDIQKAWTQDIDQLKILCDMNPACKGFNSKGWLKLNTTKRVLSKGSTLYIKWNVI